MRDSFILYKLNHLLVDFITLFHQCSLSFFLFYSNKFFFSSFAGLFVHTYILPPPSTSRAVLPLLNFLVNIHSFNQALEMSQVENFVSHQSVTMWRFIVIQMRKLRKAMPNEMKLKRKILYKYCEYCVSVCVLKFVCGHTTVYNGVNTNTSFD